MPSQDLNFEDLKVVSTLSLLTVHLSFTGPGFVAISMQMVISISGSKSGGVKLR